MHSTFFVVYALSITPLDGYICKNKRGNDPAVLDNTASGKYNEYNHFKIHDI